MKMSHLPEPYQLTPARELKSLVENRKVFTMAHCEMNIFETFEPAEQVSLQFNEWIFTAMLRGKKVMHLYGEHDFDYLPGESVILPSNEKMVIDFPEASLDHPTQCIALAIDNDKIQETLSVLNEEYAMQDDVATWRLNHRDFHILNSAEISQTINRLINVANETNPGKDIFADMALQELLIRVMQTQARRYIFDNCKLLSNQSRFAYVVNYIQSHLHENITIEKLSNIACMSKPHFFRSFKAEFGISPLDYVIHERMKFAKKLLKNMKVSLVDVSFQCGFQSVNYFCTLFKKIEGLTPGQFRKNNLNFS